MIYFQPAAEHPETPVKIAILTGLSNPWSCALSEVQRAFMASLQVPEAWKVYRNFPWTEGEGERGETPLWRAGMHNGWQFVAASTPFYRWIGARHWKALLRSSPRVVILTGSCGLQIANCLLKGCSLCATRVDIVGYGPVAWRRPRVRHRLLRNEGDRLSRTFFRKADEVLGGVGHMDYLECQRVKRVVEEWIGDSISN